MYSSWPQMVFVAEDDPELLIPLRPLPSAGVTAMSHNTQFTWCWGWNPWLHVGWASFLPTEPSSQPWNRLLYGADCFSPRFSSGNASLRFLSFTAVKALEGG